MHSSRLGKCHTCFRTPPGAFGSLISYVESQPVDPTSNTSVCRSFHRYVYPRHWSCCFKTIRVSMYRFEAGLSASKSSENDLTVTAPSSHSHFLSSLKSIAAFHGSAKKRSLFAPSDQNGALIEYGITPGATLWYGTELKSP